ncbi:Fic family protein [Fructobacillus cardui]|uniref:Fic family protein n=1 Tax=Fructobacillus cardui TaxID=2893170 RepID=A0ABN9YTH7_9LACO|nr:Fic family protein [Fructobacillus cardui]
MKNFDYQTLNHLVISPEMINKMNQIFELRGKLTGLNKVKTPILDRLVEVAKIQSTDSSNRIEGIYTSDTRLKQLVEKKTSPHNRSEAEISGYRDVLELIHESYPYIPVSGNTILTLHKRLLSFTESTWGGHFKDINNQIITQYADGSTKVRFTPPAAHMTPTLIEELCTDYNEAQQLNKFPTILLCGAFIFDFVSIHPFRDGNGRMSRLLMLLTLYQSQFDVGKYISIEALIEKTQNDYYESLENSSTGWHENTNDYAPFLNYFLSVVLQAYRELNERITLSEQDKTSAEELILQTLQDQLKPLSKSELISLIPTYSKKTIERALLELREANKIQMTGAGRSTKYILIG